MGRFTATHTDGVANGDGLKLNISESDNSQDLLAKEVAKHFRVQPEKAKKIIREVTKVVANWRHEANAFGIPQKEQNRMASAFRN